MRKPKTAIVSTLVVSSALATFTQGCDRDRDRTTGQETTSIPATRSSAAPGVPEMQRPGTGGTQLPEERAVGALETVATFDGAMPTGVAVSNDGRIFVSFPRWADPIEASVAEVKGGAPVPYPDPKWNPAHPGDPATTFVGVQSVVIDGKNRLWALDTGTVNQGKVEPGGAKLVGFDLTTNQPFTTIPFGPDIALPTSYLNDVRFDLRHGRAGYAFISDSSSSGPNAIIVVDLDSKKAWRRLVDHPSVKAAPGFLAIVEGVPVYRQTPGQARTPFLAGVDGIEVSPDGKTVFYSPLSSRKLYSISAESLADPNTQDAQLVGMVKDLGDKGASDGFIMSSDGRLYVTDYENDAILRRNADGSLEQVVTDPRLLWPDSMSLGPGGYLYVTSNQLERQPALRDGKDERQKPYSLFRVKVNGAPVRTER
jgi:sugar lactone lactonase YvrE